MHGGVYDYSKTIYKGSKENVTVVCNLHGDFEIRAKNHLVGVGCNPCGVIKSSMQRRRSYEDTVTEANIVHNFKYSYHGYEPYTAPRPSKILVGCTEHGITPQFLNNHLRGAGCLLCSQKVNLSNAEEFVEKSLALHGDLYDYTKVVYSTSKDKVTINCLKHGPWDQTPALHLSGSGCPGCSKTGYRTDRPGRLYVLDNEGVTKVGITNGPISSRLKILNRGGKNFKSVFEFYFEDGRIPRRLESQLLKLLRLSYTQPAEKFDGYTECFYNLDSAKLIEDIGRML